VHWDQKGNRFSPRLEKTVAYIQKAMELKPNKLEKNFPYKNCRQGPCLCDDDKKSSKNFGGDPKWQKPRISYVLWLKPFLCQSTPLLPVRFSKDTSGSQSTQPIFLHPLISPRYSPNWLFLVKLCYWIFQTSAKGKSRIEEAKRDAGNEIYIFSENCQKIRTANKQI